jgi:2-hydroxycyclohexanecarboxyl-CoA dehydrogenase
MITDGFTVRDKVVLVTGGAGGMGSAIARDLGSLGASVAVADINTDGANAVASSIKNATAFGVDLCDPASIDAMVAAVDAAFGRVDVLVNNAGWDKVAPFATSTDEAWDRLIAINLRAPIHLTHAFLPGMLERRAGRLIYVSSDAARVGSTGEAVYSACKAGIIGFSKTMARESARSQVTSNVVCPGPTDTPLLSEVAAGNEKLVASLKRGIPLGRLGHPDDISGAVAFLASDLASYITGQTLSISGGLTMAG